MISIFTYYVFPFLLIRSYILLVLERTRFIVSVFVFLPKLLESSSLIGKYYLYSFSVLPYKSILPVVW